MTRERGFTLVSAVFLTVVLVALGVSLMTLSSVQHTTSAQQIQAARAGYAVRTGVEWAIWMAANGGGCPGGPTTFSPGGTLASFTVSVTCLAATHDVADGSQAYYVVNVTAQSGTYGLPDYVQRRSQVKVAP